MGATVLVVDDDEFLRELIYLHLSSAGCHVLLAEDAIVAGHMLLDERVDLLIADIAMPFMDGLDLVRAIRGDASMSSLPVIFLTSDAGHEDIAAELGAVAYLKKPLHADELLATVGKHVNSYLGG